MITHEECTECLDGFLLRGTIGVPADLSAIFGDTLATRDLLLAGNFPHDLTDPATFGFDPDINFEVTGKLIRTDNINGTRSNTPVFYVETWAAVKDKE